MVRVIMGVKGTGKTKQMIELINEAAKNEAGSVVCIEHGSKLTYDIHYQIRLIEAKEYNLNITHVFVESLTKLVNVPAEDPAVEQFLDWLNDFGEKNGIKFTVTISADASLASEGVRKYF